MRISDWSSDVCSSDLPQGSAGGIRRGPESRRARSRTGNRTCPGGSRRVAAHLRCPSASDWRPPVVSEPGIHATGNRTTKQHRSEEHTSELQSLMRISYAVFCLKKKKHIKKRNTSYLITYD